MRLLSDCKQFVLRRNVVDLAMAVVIGTAFAAVVKSLVTDLITFLSIAAAIFFFVVAPVNALMKRRAKEDPDTKECPECTSAIPVLARRYPQCTAELIRAAA